MCILCDKAYKDNVCFGKWNNCHCPDCRNLSAKDREIPVTERLLMEAPVYGWRKWKVNTTDSVEVTPQGIQRDKTTTLLSPIAHNRSMTYKRNSFVAACDNRGHVAPQPGCTCGIYAFHTLDEFLDEYNVGEYEIVTLIRAFGNIEMHDRGFRTETAEVIAFLVPGALRVDKFFKNLADYYGAKVYRHMPASYNETEKKRIKRAARMHNLPNIK